MFVVIRSSGVVPSRHIIVVLNARARQRLLHVCPVMAHGRMLSFLYLVW
jgi:hypothetical protein